MGYTGDSYLQCGTMHESQSNVTDTCCLFTTLGCTVHFEKSVLGPVETLGLSGFVLNSVSITVSLSLSSALGLLTVYRYQCYPKGLAELSWWCDNIEKPDCSLCIPYTK